MLYCFYRFVFESWLLPIFLVVLLRIGNKINGNKIGNIFYIEHYRFMIVLFKYYAAIKQMIIKYRWKRTRSLLHHLMFKLGIIHVPAFSHVGGLEDGYFDNYEYYSVRIGLAESGNIMGRLVPETWPNLEKKSCWLSGSQTRDFAHRNVRRGQPRWSRRIEDCWKQIVIKWFSDPERFLFFFFFRRRQNY